jgi:hypothetical protein
MMITCEAERPEIYCRASTSRINRSEGKLSFTLNTHQSNRVMVPRCRGGHKRADGMLPKRTIHGWITNGI